MKYEAVTVGDPIRDTDYYGKFFIIPQDGADKEFLKAVCERTRSDIEIKYGFMADYSWEINTIANVFLEVMIYHLKLEYANEYVEGVGFKFYDLFSAVISNKINEHAEKEGNINIYFETGEKVDELIKNGIPPAYTGPRIPIMETFITEDPKENEDLAKIDNRTVYELIKSNGIKITEKIKLASIAIAYTFFENLFIELLVRASAQKDAEDHEGAVLVSVNFNDNIEFHCSYDDELPKIMMRPGMGLKLLVKNDGSTEKTMGDLED